jgi:hypothetical protein
VAGDAEASAFLGRITEGSGGVGLAATLTVLIASAKIYFIGRDFMELRSAPSVLRAAFNVWVGVVAVAAIALVVVPTS